ncbi:hypothetical protein BH11PLA1_BH11PLA1_04960 [soil metagenome]
MVAGFSILSPMAIHSLTATESFRLRIQRSEKTRAFLMCGVYAVLIALAVGRRLAGGRVMTDDAVFAPYVGVLLVAGVIEAVVAIFLWRGLQRGDLVCRRWMTVGAFVELAVAGGLLVVLYLWSPRGEHAAITSPVLLLLPLTVLLSIMRLRHLITLWIGLGAAALHAGLAVAVIIAERTAPWEYPVLFSYSIVLALTGLAGMMVTRAARRYVVEAVEEGAARERTKARLSSVERDLDVARQIQMGFLPAGPPHFEGFDIAGHNMPADQTGGDYYDWQELPNGRLLVVMADVTGHGIGPALVMAVCRAYARASAPLDMSPASLMARLNTLLHADISGKRFITLAMAVLDHSGQVELVSAGHGPTLRFCAATASIEEFGGDGLPLAIEVAEDYGPSRKLAMATGDLLVLLTDGITEWQNAAGEQFGTERLAKTIHAAAGQPAAEIIERLRQAVREHAAGTPQIDDVTVVVIKKR